MILALLFVPFPSQTNATGGCFSLQSQATFNYSGFNEGTYTITLTVASPGRESDIEEQTVSGNGQVTWPKFLSFQNS